MAPQPLSMTTQWIPLMSTQRHYETLTSERFWIVPSTVNNSTRLKKNVREDAHLYSYRKEKIFQLYSMNINVLYSERAHHAVTNSPLIHASFSCSPCLEQTITSHLWSFHKHINLEIPNCYIISRYFILGELEKQGRNRLNGNQLNATALFSSKGGWDRTYTCKIDFELYRQIEHDVWKYNSTLLFAWINIGYFANMFCEWTYFNKRTQS